MRMQMWKSYFIIGYINQRLQMQEEQGKEGKEGKLVKKKKVGNYIINPADRLGFGQFGDVYKAKNKENSKIAAIKVIDKKKIGDDEYNRNAIIREIEIMKNLKSENCVEFYDVSETSNNIYIIQEIADDGTLKDIIRSQPDGFLESQALFYMKQLVNGMTDLSKHGIIHRDIKPTNILVKDGILKIADFGLSRFVESEEMKMISMVGTPVYMAPQVLNLEEFQTYTYKCDIWSFGVVCYLLLCGRLPWKADTSNFVDLYKNILEVRDNGLKFITAKKISDKMKGFVDGCLQFDEAKRFDWNQILKHPIFQGYFEHKHVPESQQAYILMRLRVSIHSKNINVQKTLSTIPNQISPQDFLVIMKLLDPDIVEKEADCVFKIISKKKEKTISRDQFLKYLMGNEIKVSGLKYLIKEENEEGMEQTLEKITKSVEEKDLDLFEIFRKQEKKKKNYLNFEEFKRIASSISESISDDEAAKIFKVIDLKKTGEVAISQFYSKFCKMIQLASVVDENMRSSLKIIQSKKK